MRLLCQGAGEDGDEPVVVCIAMNPEMALALLRLRVPLRVAQAAEPQTQRVEVAGGEAEWYVGGAALKRVRAAITDGAQGDRLDGGEAWVAMPVDFAMEGEAQVRVDAMGRVVSAEGLCFTGCDQHGGRSMRSALLRWRDLESAAGGGSPWVVTPPGAVVMARFEAQVWVNDEAISVDPRGPTEWDASVAFGALPEAYRAGLLVRMAEDEAGTGRGEGLDNDDVLQSDPQAPEWVRKWAGPFNIWVRQPGAGLVGGAEVGEAG
jgi:hypothetical protein